ncbi:MAG: hypothetical protein COT90_02705 [Candidatus Diapherotrites archaeon CG10_big_fil_rev_8_21_14_0_10_31_34]|nr:MAG: hypothetical protein COT90_02705 [Candidatus Diapherotrites archaeon CG10_big_fil_rev_8_21_14_0_10_31_34]
MDLFKTAVISLFVVALIGVISVSVAAHLSGDSVEANSVDSSDADFFAEMQAMHGGNFEEFHQNLLGDNWKEEMQAMHEAMAEGNFDEMAEHCPLMKGLGNKEEIQGNTGEIDEPMQGMMQ